MFIQENMNLLSGMKQGEMVRFEGMTHPFIRLEDDGYYWIGAKGDYLFQSRYKSAVKLGVTLFGKPLEMVL